MKIRIQNQTFELLPEKAALWIEKKILIVADLHLGKVTTFQKAGIPIPEGSMDEDLLKLKDLIHRYEIMECIIVGDLIHSKTGLSALVREKIHHFLKTLACKVHLVFGNHDRPLLKSLPEEWNLQVYLEEFRIDNFCFRHHPVEDPHYFVWCGHLHPQFWLTSGADALRLPCFYLKKHLMILPAFGFFTGGMNMKKTQENEIYLVADKTVIKYRRK